VSDDFRQTVKFEDQGHVLPFGRSLGERELERQAQEQLRDGVVVTHDGHKVFLYTATRDQAAAAERVVRDVLGQEDVRAEVSGLERWHPVEERWEDASVPLPESGAEREAERDRFEEQETEEARESGYGEWQVRIDLPAHSDAVDLADRLEGEGLAPIVRRWKYLLIGAATEEDAQALAERLRGELPQGATVTAEPSGSVAWELTSRNPFAMFGSFGPR
jgi:hypothetical protein